ncbi:MAG: GrpB family protein [Clostridia bacterium]|nr:GrpB family protein [Clostridia bacterium]
MRTKHVVVLPYDEKWAQEFELIRKELSSALSSIPTMIEHVGSTAVKGLCAKPIIDIDVVVAETDLSIAIRLLQSAGYIYEGDLGIKGREAFSYEGKDHLMTHHLYVCPTNSAELKRHLAFRDYLRTHPAQVEEYEEIKSRAASLYPDDVDKYIEYKSPFIEKTYRSLGF